MKTTKATTIQNCTFIGAKLDASSVDAAKSIADAVAALARSNEAAAHALAKLAERFATASIDAMIKMVNE